MKQKIFLFLLTTSIQLQPSSKPKNNYDNLDDSSHVIMATLPNGYQVPRREFAKIEANIRTLTSHNPALIHHVKQNIKKANPVKGLKAGQGILHQHSIIDKYGNFRPHVAEVIDFMIAIEDHTPVIVPSDAIPKEAFETER